MGLVTEADFCQGGVCFDARLLLPRRRGMIAGVKRDVLIPPAAKICPTISVPVGLYRPRPPPLVRYWSTEIRLMPHNASPPTMTSPVDDDESRPFKASATFAKRESSRVDGLDPSTLLMKSDREFNWCHFRWVWSAFTSRAS